MLIESNDKNELLFKVISILLKKIEGNFYWTNVNITKGEISSELSNSVGASLSFTFQNYELDHVLSELEVEGIIRKVGMGDIFPNNLWNTSATSYSFSGIYDDFDKYVINIGNLKNKVRDMTDKFSEPKIKMIISKLDKKKDEIQEKLRKLKEMIKKKENERKIHRYIHENRLLPYKITKYEQKGGSQNRFDFLILNEYGEYELWELKSPSAKLFDGKINESKKYYENLKILQKTPILTKAIEQILVYKKYLIDHCNDEKEHGLKNHIYNAKLVVIIGSDDELQNAIILEKLNLERHAYHNLNIITYNMLYNKIENHFRPLID